MLVACGFGTNLGSSPGEPTSRRRFDSANSNGAESYDEVNKHGLSLPFDAKSGAFHLERLMRCAISLRRRTKERDDARAELLKFKVHVNLSCAVFRTSDFLCFVCSLVCLTIWCCACGCQGTPGCMHAVAKLLLGLTGLRQRHRPPRI